MKTALQLRSRLAFGREILTQQDTFLPVPRNQEDESGTSYRAEMQHSGTFLPFFSLNRKNLIVAQPLLLEVLR